MTLEAIRQAAIETRPMSRRWLVPGIVSLLQPLQAAAQEISTVAEPVSVVEIPLADPAALVLLALALAMVGCWTLFKRRGLNGAPLLWSGLLLLLIWSTSALRAQVLSQFTDPGGETLPIPVVPIEVAGQLVGFEPAVFSNAAGVDLRVVDLDPPAFEDCFPGGLDTPLPPAGAVATPSCQVDALLAPGAECVVDVDAICKQLASAFAVIDVTPPDLTFVAGDSGALVVGNDAGSLATADDLTAILPVGSALTIQGSTCPPSLPAGDTCEITLASAVAEAATLVTVAGSNTNEVTVEVTISPLTTLSASAAVLALSVNDAGADPSLSGNPRTISVTNTGSAPASGIQLAVAGLPAGTAITSETCTGSLAAGNTCTVTITPGATASPDTGSDPCTTAPGTEPVPDTVSLTADNAPPVDVGVLVLGYGCIHQAGFLFAIDDATPASGSIGGKVAALTDEAGALVWATLLDDTVADSLTDGQANTNSLAAPVGQYAAAQSCLARTDQGFTDWYLPAICELGRFVGSGTDAGCGTTAPNLYTTLAVQGLGGFANDLYWSSTEYNNSNAWGPAFASGFFDPRDKMLVARVRCVRAFAP